MASKVLSALSSPTNFASIPTLRVNTNIYQPHMFSNERENGLLLSHLEEFHPHYSTLHEKVLSHTLHSTEQGQSSPTDPWNLCTSTLNEELSIFPQYHNGATTNIEPIKNPYLEDIAWNDLVYWFGDINTGTLECSCTKCSNVKKDTQWKNRKRNVLVHPYRKTMSLKIPVGRLPRIEGIN